MIEAAIFGIQGKLAQGSTACTCVALARRERNGTWGGFSVGAVYGTL